MGKASELWRAIKPQMGEIVRYVNEAEHMIEQAKTEVYQVGYTAGKLDAIAEGAMNETALKKEAEDSYQKGLSDAWECARKIQKMWADMNSLDLLRVFNLCAKRGEHAFYTLLHEQSAAEAIAKIAEYEKQKKEINPWDEVMIDGDTRAICTYVDERCGTIFAMYSDGSGEEISADKVQKTGRSFPELADMLQKMKEGDHD